MLPSAYVIYEALTSSGWYDNFIDTTDSTMDEPEEFDSEYETSKSYLIYGGIAAFTADAVVLFMILMGGLADAPAPEPEPEDLPPITEDATDSVELSVW